MTTDRETLEQRLRDRGEPVPQFTACPNPLCRRDRCRPFEIVTVADRANIPSEMACTQCLVSDDREQAQIDEHVARMALPPWETPEGAEWKARRNRMLDTWRWTILPDSPLTERCQLKFKRYLLAWQRMTVDSAVISAFKEPELPAMEYAPLDQITRKLGL